MIINYSSYKAVRRIPKLIIITCEKKFIARNLYHYKVFTVQESRILLTTDVYLIIDTYIYSSA